MLLKPLIAQQTRENSGNIMTSYLTVRMVKIRELLPVHCSFNWPKTFLWISATFQTCIDNSTHSKKVEDNVTYGQGKGVNGTPFFLVNDQLVEFFPIGSRY